MGCPRSKIGSGAREDGHGLRGMVCSTQPKRHRQIDVRAPREYLRQRGMTQIIGNRAAIGGGLLAERDQIGRIEHKRFQSEPATCARLQPFCGIAEACRIEH